MWHNRQHCYIPLASEEVHHSHSFLLTVVRELLEGVDDEAANSADHGNDSSALLLENLFHYPSDTESTTVKELMNFWTRSPRFSYI